ncbi:transporter [Bacillus solimangrovi]|nr:transporter [Bacillus solimangrovi]
MNKFQRIYEGIMILLVMLTIMTLWQENTYNTTLNWIVWFVFFIDFVIRLSLAKQKLEFLKKNPFLVIAVIPLDQFFQVARIVRVIYLFRIKTIIKHYIRPYADKLTYQSKVWIFIGLLCLLFAESIIIWMMESQVESIIQSFQYILQHLMFFGRKTLHSEHALTMWLFVFTSIVGIILHGIAVQWVFERLSSFMKKQKKVTNKNY